MADGNLYHRGVWLTQNSGGKAERYKKWSDVRKDKKLENLGREEHDCIVRMNVKKLELQAELDKLQKSKKAMEEKRTGSSGSTSSHSSSTRTRDKESKYQFSKPKSTQAHTGH